MPSDYSDILTGSLANFGSNIFKGLAQGRAAVAEQDKERRAEEQQGLLSRLRAKQVELAQRRLDLEAERVRQPVRVNLGGVIAEYPHGGGPPTFTHAPLSPEKQVEIEQKQRDRRDMFDKRERDLDAKHRTKEMVDIVVRDLEKAGQPFLAHSLRAQAESPDFDVSKLTSYASLLHPKAPTTLFGLFQRAHDPSLPPDERKAALSQYGEYQRGQVNQYGAKMRAQGEAIDSLPPSHTLSPYRGRVWIDPKTFATVPPPRTTGEGTAAYSRYQRVPVTNQQAQQIARFRIADTAIDALEKILPHVAAASMGASTWEQFVKNLGLRFGGSTAFLAAFDALSNDVMVELAAALTGSARPAITLMKMLKDHTIPKDRETLAAGHAKLGIARGTVRNRMEAVLGQAELTPLNIPGLRANPADFEIEDQ